MPARASRYHADGEVLGPCQPDGQHLDVMIPNDANGDDKRARWRIFELTRVFEPL
jgi:hypothetical protein